ncbi:NAD(P)-dependent oxidoreductase [Paenisporosarcina cavernae]|uniref:NAD(P)-dependent oxidoreductase n=1 Tax=Paenisporosarcina cavernae TaxID=2320858 RepID=A0A385YQU2_9BACL|nr:NAD(P)-dependent oxidoreductase [Paenisporosarcina cavernae]AYC29069.1 NAD(P)-dependent oxidoreductase [Paenisporosarcina cavernae]
MTKQWKIGFVGTGVMGKSIVKHLHKEGHDITIYTRTKEKANDLLDLGIAWANTPGEAAKNAELVFTMVGYPKDVEEVYYGETGIFANLGADSIVVDLTTSTPTLASQLFDDAKKKGISSLDAPVSGGDIGAQNGTLSIMVGGEKEVFETIYPLFELFGSTIVYQGKAGSGQHTKMANQIGITGTMIAACEAITYAKAAGLDSETVLSSITGGAAGSWTLSNLAPRMLKEDFAPGFFMKHFIKDMRIALEEAAKMELRLPGLQMVYNMYLELAEQGLENEGTQSFIKYYQS